MSLKPICRGRNNLGSDAISGIQTVVCVLILSLFVSLVSPKGAGADEAQITSCECTESRCGACEVETGVTFYSEKCGAGMAKVKSCKKPTCVPFGGSLESKNKCLSQLKDATSGRPRVDGKVESGVPSTAASTSDERAGDVVLAVGNTAFRRGGDEKLLALVTGLTLHKGDEIVTGTDGRVRVRFPELSEIFVGPKTNLKITDATGSPLEPKRKVLLNLIQGKVRSRVQGRHDSAGSRFEVQTRTAVAGVRGTDFVTSYERTDTTWTTEVRTLEGEVRLQGLNPGSQQSVVGAMTYGAHVVPAPAGATDAIFSDSDRVPAAESEDSLEKSYLTPVFKLNPDQKLELDRDLIAPLELGASANAPSRTVASSSESESATLCSSPGGTYNQCAWTCDGNPKGSKTCRTDLKGVSCVRRLCRASGQWAEPTILTPKDGAKCDAAKPVVGDCGSYW